MVVDQEVHALPPLLNLDHCLAEPPVKPLNEVLYTPPELGAQPPLARPNLDYCLIPPGRRLCSAHRAHARLNVNLYNNLVFNGDAG
ncbi:hypothetical protein D3C81_2036310 [compost metagenome]